MKLKKTSLAAWTSFVLIALVTLAWVIFITVSASFTTAVLFNHITFAIFLLVSAMVGTLILSHQPRNTIGWLLIFPCAASVIADILTRILLKGTSSTTLLVGAWLGNWSWWLLMGPFFSIPLLFPTGRLLSPAWKWVALMLGATFGIFLFLITFSIRITNFDNPQLTYTNPIGFLSDEFVNRSFIPFELLLVTTAILCISSIFVRYRRASQREREQIKWLLFAGAVFIPIFALFTLPKISDNEWAGVVFNLVGTGFPAAIGIAILGYRLYDIDIIIRRTIVYGTLTLLLGVLYAGLIIVLQRLFTSITGQENPAALVASTLAIVALFNPLRVRLQQFIDRRFYRSHYSTEQALNQFLAGAQTEDDIDRLAHELLNLAQETVKPQTASFWVNSAEESR